MKTFRIKILNDETEGHVRQLLAELEANGSIQLTEDQWEPTPDRGKDVTENQAQEMIEEAELGPYYSEKEAKDILKI
ncbi:hypothetical protein DSL64_22350 [Dyadobacter luteus]|jgi:ribosomal protein S19E (S16A)|uniref:Uncharacterized protein n=1 Tax=Dyadobacter luteus TaxID=2259619 RepID=A0A3D8Y5I0_9BACT|nr:hypothetical protein [Dyadobacter luteus]REA57870.1 hypothetical protein DSL64_22350 [Dyadobacter luteus]